MATPRRKRTYLILAVLLAGICVLMVNAPVLTESNDVRRAYGAWLRDRSSANELRLKEATARLHLMQNVWRFSWMALLATDLVVLYLVTRRRDDVTASGTHSR